jgi:DNA-directed RNA polymerase specialized sigma24 family protein
MDRMDALAELPETYATALRLRDRNLNNEAIAEHLGIGIEGVQTLLRVADAKLKRLLSERSQ